MRMHGYRFLILAFALSIIHNCTFTAAARPRALEEQNSEWMTGEDQEFALGRVQADTSGLINEAKTVETREHTESRLIRTIACVLLGIVSSFIVLVSWYYGGKLVSDGSESVDLTRVLVDVKGEREEKKADPKMNEFLGLVIDAAHKQEKLPDNFSVKVNCQPANTVSEITPVEDAEQFLGWEKPKLGRIEANQH